MIVRGAAHHSSGPRTGDSTHFARIKGVATPFPMDCSVIWHSSCVANCCPQLRPINGCTWAWLMPSRHVSTKAMLIGSLHHHSFPLGTYVEATLRQLLDKGVAPRTHCNEK